MTTLEFPTQFQLNKFLHILQMNYTSEYIEEIILRRKHYTFTILTIKYRDNKTIIFTESLHTEIKRIHREFIELPTKIKNN